MDTMNTDTPESILPFTSLFAGDDAYWVPFIVASKLERERDELREDLEFRRGLYALQTEALEKAREERDEARQWESQALVARIQRDEFSKTLGEVREILCNAMPNENAPTSFMAATLVKERDEAQKQLLNLWKP
jgi:hypothetical protein